jgi:hypothetical protein
MRNSALKWLMSLVLPTVVATVTATVFVLAVTHINKNAAPDKTEGIAKLQTDVADLQAKLRDLQNAEKRKDIATKAPADGAPPRTFKIGPPEKDLGSSVEVRFRDRGIYLYQAEQHLGRFKGLGRWPWEEKLASRRAEFTEEARDRAKRLCDEAFRAWAEVHKEHDWLVDHEDELLDIIRPYQKHVLKGQKLPDDFPLRHIPSLLPRMP